MFHSVSPHPLGVFVEDARATASHNFDNLKYKKIHVMLVKEERTKVRILKLQYFLSVIHAKYHNWHSVTVQSCHVMPCHVMWCCFSRKSFDFTQVSSFSHNTHNITFIIFMGCAPTRWSTSTVAYCLRIDVPVLKSIAQDSFGVRWVPDK